MTMRETILYFFVTFIFFARYTIAVFDISTSEFAFVKLEEWKPCRNGSIELEFKTLQENALILYTDDGGLNDFFEVKLLKGVMHLLVNLGSGRMRIAAGEYLNDFAWHKVLIVRNEEEISLHVDDWSQTRRYQGKDQQFGIQNKFNNYVFIGGISKEYEDKTNALTVETIFFQPRFTGSMRNILYSNCGGPKFRPKILDSFNISLGNFECLTNSPCLNNGICLEKDQGTSCDCSATNFRGDNCEIEKTPTEVTFSGGQYLTYNFAKDNLTQFSHQSTQDNIDLYFRTQQPDGLLFYIGDQTDHIMITLRNGGVSVRVNLGSGAWEQQLPSNGYRFDDNQWHHVQVKRKSREIHVEVDGSHRLDGTTIGAYSILDMKTLYVGGGPNPLYKNMVVTNFKGCLKQVTYVSKEISFDLTTMALEGDLTVIGDVLYNQCQEMVEAQPITFVTQESYIELPNWEVYIHGGSLSFTFQTNELTGIILYDYNSRTSDFFAFELLDGYLNFLINLGSGTEIVKTNKYISDGKIHSVSVRHAGKTGTVVLDGFSTRYDIGGDSNHLDLDRKLYVGGVDESLIPTLPTELWSGQLSKGFVGCLHDLVINGNKVDLITAARKQRSSGIKDYCRVMEPQCNQGSCLHHGRCDEGWNWYLCDCRGTGYGGPICHTGATTLEFDGTQFLKITMEVMLVTEAEDISLRFRTTQENGLLFVTSADESHDKMELYLESGSIKLDIKIGQTSKFLSMGTYLNDDRWHTVYLKRRGEIIQLKVDEGNPILENLLDRQLNVKQIVLGSVSPMLSDEYIFSDSEVSEIRRIQHEDTIQRRDYGFFGAMQQFIFNNIDYFDLAKSRKLENIEVTAIFDTEDPVLIDPVTFKSKDAFVSLSPLDANTHFHIYLKFKTTEPDGLILFNGGKQDFLALELQGGNLHYVYDTGNGGRRIFVTTRQKLNNNLWHDVSLIRSSVERQLIRVDDNPPTIEDMQDFSSVHFNLDGDLYIGGVSKMMFNTLPTRISSRHGFQGCLASLDLNGIKPNLFKAAGGNNNGIAESCLGPSSGCSDSSCHNSGRCVPRWNSFTCDCDMTSFTGPTCNEESVSYSFGVHGGLITYERSKGNYFDTTQDQFALGFSTSRRNAILFRVESEKGKDFIELSLSNGNLLAIYNMGTDRKIPIGETLKTFDDRKYHIVRFKRSGSNATMQIDNDRPITKIPDVSLESDLYDLQLDNKEAHQQKWNIFNQQARMYVGGMKGNGRIDKPFQGTISGLVFNGIELLKEAAEGNRKITIQGDIRLIRREILSTRETRQTTPMQGIADEIIVSTEDSTDCISDDEDECMPSSGGGSADDIIQPTSQIIRFSTPKPPETPQPSTQQDMNRLCEDGIDCQNNNNEGETTRVAAMVTTLRTSAQVPDPGDDKKRLALYIGIGVGVLFTLIILIIALYKFRSRDEGTYKVDESKNFAYLESKNVHAGNGAIIGPSNIKSGKKKDVKEWYV